MRLEKSLDEDIQGLPWMTDDTKKQAKIKLQAIRNKIGYPDVWRDYSSLTIVRGDLLGNFLRANEFESKRQIAKIGKPLDRKEWGMTPPTVNAYYSARRERNRISRRHFAAAIFRQNDGRRSEFRRHRRGDRPRTDPRLRRSGTEVSIRKATCAIGGPPRMARSLKSAPAASPTNTATLSRWTILKLNGRLTLGENTADNGGARIALMALEHMIAEDKTGKEGQKIDGYTPQQRFFLGFGRVWCEKQPPRVSPACWSPWTRTRPGNTASTAWSQNMPEFQQAWGCKAGQPMVSANACRVW